MWRPEPRNHLRQTTAMIFPRVSAHPGDDPSRDAAQAPQAESFGPVALGPASRLRRRYADAPAGAPRCAPSAPAEARRRFPPASKCGFLAAFISAKFTGVIHDRMPIILILLDGLRQDGFRILAKQRDGRRIVQPVSSGEAGRKERKKN